MPVLLNKGQGAWTYCAVPKYELSKIAMALPLKAEHASATEDFESDKKTVKLVVVKGREESPAEQKNLASFEAMILPHLHAAHNLARSLLRHEADAQAVLQEAYLRALKAFSAIKA